MLTLFPTKDTGAKTLPTLMTIAAPEQQMSLDALQQLGAAAGLNGLLLANLLSCFSQLERDAVHLYRVLAERTHNDDWRSHYEEFGRESEDHVRIYGELITKLGGDPQYVSPNARMTEFKDSKLLEALLFSGSVDEFTLELTGLEAVISSEQQCHSNWELLLALAEQVDDTAIKGAIQDAVNQVMPQEDKHLAWAKSTWQKTVLGAMTQR
jgi:rubrerythrin